MARRAGPSEASTVTRMPITRPRTMSLGATATSIGAVAGSSGSSAKPAPTTAATPIAEETSPSTSASSSTERWIWPPVAPRQRSSASSRARWAVSTPKVVVITRKATSTASATIQPGCSTGSVSPTPRMASARSGWIVPSQPRRRPQRRNSGGGAWSRSGDHRNFSE